MGQDQQTPDPAARRGPAPLTPAARHRLQKVFEHAQRCAAKNDFDYATQLLTQCVAEDPGNLVYVQNFLANLQKKFGDNKKGAKLAGLKIKSQRMTLSKAAGKGEWQTAFEAGCAALALNPWDIPTLRAMAQACDELKIDECQLFYLRWAIDTDPKDAGVNRQAALTLQRIGQFEQAIACWNRVSQANAEDDEARQAISQLSVEKAIQEGGYDSAILSSQDADELKDLKVSQFARGASEKTASDAAEDLPTEERLRKAIASDLTEVANYLQLADFLMHEQRLDEAEELLTQGASAVGSGNLQIRERLEDVQLRRARQQQAIAEKRAAEQPTEENEQLAARLRGQSNQVELEVYAARSDRDPGNQRLKYELGLRLKRAGKYKDAITALQAARGESKRKAIILLELGECFQRIEQYKLALTNYEQAVEACEEPDSETRRLALYRAGVLSTGLREFDRAERHLTELAGIDFGYRDVAERLDKISQLRDSM